MNLVRSQQPYVFHPPKFSPMLAPLLGLINDRFLLRRWLRVRSTNVTGDEAVAERLSAGDSVLITPNHGDHADPHVLLHVGRRRRWGLHFMAAREAFERHFLLASLLQCSGAFSVDREGTDLAAIKTAIRILREGKHPLVIFPEGEIYHHLEQLDPLREGVATILLRANEKIRPPRALYVVPTALRYYWDPAVESGFSDRLGRLEQRITWKPRPYLSVIDRIYRLGGGLMAIKEEEFLGRAQTGTLVERIERLRDELVCMVEARYPPPRKADALPERVKWLRAKIRKILLEEKQTVTPQQEWELYDDLDTLFVAMQLYSYPGQYLKWNPSLHRIAESIFKLEEDLFGKGDYAADRDVSVQFGTPVRVDDMIRSQDRTPRSESTLVTRYLHAEIQRLLDQGPQAGSGQAV